MCPKNPVALFGRALALATGICGLIAFAGAGCATTPQDRIRAKPELFAAFPPEAQEAIRAGRVEPGFTPDMVRMALGEPSVVTTRKTDAGETTIWTYTDAYPEVVADPMPYYWPYRAGPRMRYYPEIGWVYRTWWRDRVVARVEFREGRATSVELIRR